MIHKNRKFEIKETAKCLDLMCDFLNYAQENNYTVLVSWLA